jgi:hypothetical protein
MHPNRVPFAVVAEGLIHPDECQKIVMDLNPIAGFEHGHCGAFTREVGHRPVLENIRLFGHRVNQTFWDYELDEDTMTWMQTYEAGSEYQLHTDMSPGQMRKMTAVVFLTDPDNYVGGNLEIFFHPQSVVIPRTQGTVVFFQPWILHKVYGIVYGIRQTLNMSFWGPNFR